jgi:signal transduction histidine kinase
LYLLNSVGYQVGTAIEQARLYRRLERADERHRALLQHALIAQEGERKRIARELHDETSQAITALTLSLQAAVAAAEARDIVDTDLIGRLKKVQSLAVHAGNEIVRIMKELRPTLLDELGLVAAINRYAKDSLEPQGINVSTQFKGMDERLPSDIEVTLFRVAQGGIGNILKHSQAKNASIALECNARECVLRIQDDGKGFDVSKITGVDESGRGAGVFTAKERVRLVGGTCNIKSKEGKGTEVVVKVPLAGNMAHAEDNGADS